MSDKKSITKVVKDTLNMFRGLSNNKPTNPRPLETNEIELNLFMSYNKGLECPHKLSLSMQLAMVDKLNYSREHLEDMPLRLQRDVINMFGHHVRYNDKRRPVGCYYTAPFEKPITKAVDKAREETTSFLDFQAELTYPVGEWSDEVDDIVYSSVVFSVITVSRFVHSFEKDDPYHLPNMDRTYYVAELYGLNDEYKFRSIPLTVFEDMLEVEATL